MSDFMRVTDLPIGRAIVAIEEKFSVYLSSKEYWDQTMTISYFSDEVPQALVDELYNLAEKEGWSFDIQKIIKLRPSVTPE